MLHFNGEVRSAGASAGQSPGNPAGSRRPSLATDWTRLGRRRGRFRIRGSAGPKPPIAAEMAAPPVVCILGRNLGKEMRCLLTTFPGFFFIFIFAKVISSSRALGLCPRLAHLPVSHTPGLEVAVGGEERESLQNWKRTLPLCHLAP